MLKTFREKMKWTTLYALIYLKGQFYAMSVFLENTISAGNIACIIVFLWCV
jgi:hypothetical protein